MLELHGLEVYYGDFEAVRGLSLSLSRGDAAGLTGKNGVGKTSTLKGVLGLVKSEGRVILNGEEISSLAPHRRVARGIGYLPQEIKVFRQLTVEENLKLVIEKSREDRLKGEVLDLFPDLGGRFNQKAASLSGGEQTMVALARLLLAEQQLMLLDEPTEGLMPEMERVLLCALKEGLAGGSSVLIAEQNLSFLKDLTSRVYRLEGGKIKGVEKQRSS